MGVSSKRTRAATISSRIEKLGIDRQPLIGDFGLAPIENDWICFVLVRSWHSDILAGLLLPADVARRPAAASALGLRAAGAQHIYAEAYLEARHVFL